jgi:hypothetical protein
LKLRILQVWKRYQPVHQPIKQSKNESIRLKQKLIASWEGDIDFAIAIDNIQQQQIKKNHTTTTQKSKVNLENIVVH